MSKFYSPTTAKFYDDAPQYHRPRRIMAPDPSFVATEENPTAPLIEVDNPHTLIPADAVLVSDDSYAALFTAQAAGKDIVPGPDGAPIAADRPPLAPDAAWANLRAQRNNLLTATDGRMAEDAPDGPKAALRIYRQLLRDLPKKMRDENTDPNTPVWPVAPA